MTATRVDAGLPALALVTAGTLAFAWYAYQSDYGYDALEYLAIGRELSRGVALYDFAPSKGPGIYLVSAAAHAAGLFDSRVGLALAIAALATACAIFAARVAANDADPSARWIAGGIAWLGAAAMEQNFLETEGFVLLSGLMALASVPEARAGPPGRWFLAGAAIGLGALFKAVALAYGLGLALLVFFSQVDPVRNRIGALAALAAGAAAVVGGAAAAFAMQGAFEPFLRWSFVYPLTVYPGDEAFGLKTMLKTCWLTVPIVCFVIGGLFRASWAPGFRSRRAVGGIL